VTQDCKFNLTPTQLLGTTDAPDRPSKVAKGVSDVWRDPSFLLLPFACPAPCSVCFQATESTRKRMDKNPYGIEIPWRGAVWNLH